MWHLTNFEFSMYSLIKSILFFIPAERAHYFAMNSLSFLSRIGVLKYFFTTNYQPVSQFGLDFRNRLGMAAGFDKNAAYLHVLEDLGFGFVEIGTVTPRPQEGNPKPRLFRLKSEEALLNRMGFNNLGADAVVENLKKYRKNQMIVGGNIGKNKDTPNESAFLDYEICFEKLFPYVDYFVINVSSPNTPNLRELQEKDMLLKIIETIEKKQNQFGLQKPLLLKIAPDLNENQLDEIVYVFQNSILEGLIVSNTTIDRSIIADYSSYEAMGNGGLSGKPLADKTNSIISYLKSKDASMPIIGVGGIDSREEAENKMALGCELIQIYSAFIYKGPQLVDVLTM